jgi:hypothetical protein
MANYDKAWALTSSHEGEWDNRGGDPGHLNHKGTLVGTTFGVTPQFLRNYVPGWYVDTFTVLIESKIGSYEQLVEIRKVITEDDMKSLQKNCDAAEIKIQNDKGRLTCCKEIKRTTCWTWMAGDKIQDQSIASLLFDWCVRADGDLLTKFPTLFQLKGINALDSYSYAPGQLKNDNNELLFDDVAKTQPMMRRSINTRRAGEPNAMDKVKMFSDKFVDEINTYEGIRAKKLFDDIKGKASDWYKGKRVGANAPDTTKRLELYEYNNCRDKYGNKDGGI